MDGLLLDKIHNSLEACFSVDERIGEKVWAAVVGLLDGFLDISRQEVFFSLKTSTIIFAQGSKWPFFRKYSHRKQCLKKRGNLWSSFVAPLYYYNVRRRFLQ